MQVVRNYKGKMSKKNEKVKLSLRPEIKSIIEQSVLFGDQDEAEEYIYAIYDITVEIEIGAEGVKGADRFLLTVVQCLQHLISRGGLLVGGIGSYNGNDYYWPTDKARTLYIEKFDIKTVLHAVNERLLIENKGCWYTWLDITENLKNWLSWEFDGYKP